MNGNSNNILVILSKKPSDYFSIIINAFYQNLTNITYKLIYNNKILNNNICFYNQGIINNSNINIIFSEIVLDMPILFLPQPNINTRIIFRNMLNELNNITNIPDNYYIKFIDFLEYTRNEMNFIWFNIDIYNKRYNVNYYYSRYGGQYKNYCSRCYEGCHSFYHTCDIDALNLALALPNLIDQIDNCCTYYLFE